MVTDPDTFPPEVCTAPECKRPHGCCCEDDEVCQLDLIGKFPRRDFKEVEMPSRG